MQSTLPRPWTMNLGQTTMSVRKETMRLAILSFILLLIGTPCPLCFAQPKEGAAKEAGSRDAGDITKPTLITLKLNDVSPQQVFEEVAKDAGTEFSLMPKTLWTQTATPMTVSYENQPFWQVMRDACAKADLSLKHATDTAEPRIILAKDKQDWTQYPAVATGPFLVNLIGLHRASTVDMRKPGEVNRTFYAKFTVFCEPRVRLLRGSLTAKVETAADDKGNSIAPKQADPDAETMNFITSWVYNIEAKLDYPKEAGTKIPSLRCSAKFLAQTQSETITIADPLARKGDTETVAGRKITLKELKHTPEEWEATFILSRGSLTPDQWSAALFPGHSMKLVDADGRSVIAKGFGLGGKGDESTFIFKFEKDPPKGTRIGKPVKLVWEIPTQIKSLPLEFEFKDVTMP